MSSESDKQPPKVEPINRDERPRNISAELATLVEQVRAEVPDAVAISFEFEDDLHLHIDVRTLQESQIIKARLPALCGGIFSGMFSGDSPHHPFFHRVSAKVDK